MPLPVLAHIAGVPVEETLLYAAPWVSLVGGLMVMRARDAISRRTGPRAGLSRPGRRRSR